MRVVLTTLCLIIVGCLYSCDSKRIKSQQSDVSFDPLGQFDFGSQNVEEIKEYLSKTGYISEPDEARYTYKYGLSTKERVYNTELVINTDGYPQSYLRSFTVVMCEPEHMSDHCLGEFSDLDRGNTEYQIQDIRNIVDQYIEWYGEPDDEKVYDHEEFYFYEGDTANPGYYCFWELDDHYISLYYPQTSKSSEIFHNLAVIEYKVKDYSDFLGEIKDSIADILDPNEIISVYFYNPSWETETYVEGGYRTDYTIFSSTYKFWRTDGRSPGKDDLDIELTLMMDAHLLTKLSRYWYPENVKSFKMDISYENDFGTSYFSHEDWIQEFYVSYLFDDQGDEDDGGITASYPAGTINELEYFRMATMDFDIDIRGKAKVTAIAFGDGKVIE